ncbi:amino acid ABC transporter permease [Lactobacillus salivarius]|uniref:amino acid ABC transporter permease n=1 Tax=Ligilactobacillus salivarius TaxID=1624 RepID=UPI00136D17D0|nr:amino acid ABC transporter permease [Ligilactobacillus salivarius]MYU58041.1 amino acid ABC transporter permease [Ligilactobacillus salivarius]MYU84136.1 amino acid ABC transporter permease [Ligilactobacillus salivarius]MYU90939.1 amino acid ABC transporter permease [Ligilactobacillus salivarius]
MNYVLEVLPSLLDGAKMTLQIFCWTLVGSLPLGLIVGLALISRFRLLKAILRFYVWLMRGTPLLLQLIFVFYGLPLVGLTLGRFDAALFAFILNYTAYFAEIFRGGLQSIDKGQYESAKVLRLTYWQTIRKIVTPQVVKIVLPSIGNEVINLVKDSSLVYVIGIGDLLRAGNVATSRDVTLVPLVMVGVVYLVMTAVLTFILRKLEQYYSYWK